MKVAVSHPPCQTFRIGAVSRLTGITTSLIRVWEKRHKVVEPVRTDTGNRLYQQEDIARLALIKSLLDSGDTIGSIAALSLTQLEERVAAMGSSAQPSINSRESIRIAVVGHALTARASRHRGELGELELAGIFHCTEDLRQESASLNIGIVVVEYPYVKNDTPSEIQQLICETGAKGAVVVFGFGARRYVRRFDFLPVIALRAPTDLEALRRACLAVFARVTASSAEYHPGAGALSSTIPPRHYDDEQLARIATLSTVIECECPHHLADLVLSLSSFERYSLDCTNRTEEDAAMHRYLHATTAQARSQLEAALARLIEVEGLKI